MVQAHFIQSDTVRLQCFEHGHGRETLVLVHGYQTSGRIWRLTQEALDPAQYRTIAISNRGAGDSDRGQTEADYTVQAFARDLLHALNVLDVQDFTLVGHSMGGATVAQFALQHARLLKGLVLLNSAPSERPASGGGLGDAAAPAICPGRAAAGELWPASRDLARRLPQGSGSGCRPESSGAGSGRTALHVPVTVARAIIATRHTGPGGRRRSGHYGGSGEYSGGLPRPACRPAFPAYLSWCRPFSQCRSTSGAGYSPQGFCRSDCSHGRSGGGQRRLNQTEGPMDQ